MSKTKVSASLLIVVAKCVKVVWLYGHLTRGENVINNFAFLVAAGECVDTYCDLLNKVEVQMEERLGYADLSTYKISIKGLGHYVGLKIDLLY